MAIKFWVTWDGDGTAVLWAKKPEYSKPDIESECGGWLLSEDDDDNNPLVDVDVLDNIKTDAIEEFEINVDWSALGDGGS